MNGWPRDASNVNHDLVPTTFVAAFFLSDAMESGDNENVACVK